MSKNGATLKPFVDWYEIWPGQAGRRKDDGGSWLQDPPEGVRLSIQEARRSEPIVRAEKPWEVDSVVYPCVIHEDGRYRMWHWSQTKEGRFNCYQESDDGMRWERPELGFVDFRGSTANNLISSHEEFEIDSVFVDPTAGPEERYKAICPKTIFFRDGALDPEMDWPKFREPRAADRRSKRSYPQHNDRGPRTIRGLAGQCRSRRRLRGWSTLASSGGAAGERREHAAGHAKRRGIQP